MASPPVLEFEALLAPIPGANPAGSESLSEIRSRLEEARKEENPEEYAPDDPMRPEEPKRADWPFIIRFAQETLTGTTKHLEVGARLTEALTRRHGFAGLRDGLRLLRELAEQCWDRLNPPIEDGDLEVRAGPFHWLDDSDRGARFPNTLRLVPLVSGKETQFSWMDWDQAQKGRGQFNMEQIERAILAAPAERCQSVAEDIDQSLQELSQLTHSLTQKMGPVAPGLTSVRQVLEQCRQLTHTIVQRKGPAGTSAEAGGAGTEVPAAGENGAARHSPGGAPATRAEAYRQLAQAAAVLQRLEPHSPIPYLIQRAVHLGQLPFPQLMKALLREQNVLAELSRELGLQEAGPEASTGEAKS